MASKARYARPRCHSARYRQPDSEHRSAHGRRSNSSLTRIQPVFGAAIDRDASGATWLPGLLEASGARTLLGGLVDAPGTLSPRTTAPSASRKAEWECSEVAVPPDRRLLSWAVEHAEQLNHPRTDSTALSDANRRRLICDNPPGSREAAREEARDYVRSGDVSANDWRRFERETEVDCVLETERLVLCIEGKRNEQLSTGSTWIPHRNQIARNLEAAWRIAGTRRAFAVLVCVESTDDPTADPAFVKSAMARASPHLFDAERARLADAYLGQLTWTQVCTALELNPAGLPETRVDVPGCRQLLLAS